MSHAMLANFPRRWLRYSQQRLILLSIVGIELVWLEVGSYWEMMGLAEETAWDGRFMAWASNQLPPNAAAW